MSSTGRTASEAPVARAKARRDVEEPHPPGQLRLFNEPWSPRFTLPQGPPVRSPRSRRPRASQLPLFAEAE